MTCRWWRSPFQIRIRRGPRVVERRERVAPEPPEPFEPTEPTEPSEPNSVGVVVRGIALLRRAAQLVVLALGTPRVGVESLRAGVRLDLAVRAELLVAVL